MWRRWPAHASKDGRREISAANLVGVFGLGDLISAFFLTEASAGLAWDLTVAAVALVVWIVFEAFQRSNFSGLVSIPLILCIGLGCGLPFYFFMRLRMRKDIE